jgi:hypothetical protein
MPVWQRHKPMDQSDAAEIKRFNHKINSIADNLSEEVRKLPIRPKY